MCECNHLCEHEKIEKLSQLVGVLLVGKCVSYHDYSNPWVSETKRVIVTSGGRNGFLNVSSLDGKPEDSTLSVFDIQDVEP